MKYWRQNMVLCVLGGALFAPDIQGATSFTGSAGAAVDSAGNWDSGLPTLSNPGLLAGNDSGSYSKQGSLDGMALDISGNAELVGTKKTGSSGADVTIRENGRWQADEDVILGNKNDSGTTVAIQDSGAFEVDGDLTLGKKEQATVVQSGGSVTTTGALEIGSNASAAGSSYQLSGGNLTVADDVSVRRGTALNVAGGTANFAGDLEVRDNGSVYTQSGGTLNAAQDVTFDSGTAGSVSGGQLNVSGSLEINDSVTMTQTGGLVDVTGDLEINGSGVYDLTSGELQVNGSISVSSANGFLWGTGGTLGAHPGDSTIEFNGDLNAGPGARLDLDSPAESLLVLNELNLNGTLTIDGYDVGLPAYSGAVQTGQLVLVEAALINGTVADIEFTNFTGLGGMTRINAGDSFNAGTDSVYWFNVSGNQVTMAWSMGALPPVPEPATGALLLSGALLLLRRRR